MLFRPGSLYIQKFCSNQWLWYLLPLLVLILIWPYFFKHQTWMSKHSAKPTSYIWICTWYIVFDERFFWNNCCNESNFLLFTKKRSHNSISKSRSEGKELRKFKVSIFPYKAYLKIRNGLRYIFPEI